MKIVDLIKDIEKNPVEAKGQIYHPIPFQEFEHLSTSSSKEAVYKKWGIIKYWIEKINPDFTKIKVLDIGANAGFYSFSLAQLGAGLLSFERHERYGEIGKCVAKTKQLKVDWRPKAFDSKSITVNDKFDAALLLSVFQWMAEGDIDHKEALASLRLISNQSEHLFFELAYNSGKSCVRTNKLNHYAEMIQFLKRTTSYTHFKLVGKTRLWRGKKRYLILCSRNPAFEDTGYSALVRKIKI